MTVAVLTADDEMQELAARLVQEYHELPPARVLRCLMRALRRAQSWGCPQEHLSATVEASTRWGLAQPPPSWVSG